MRQRTLEFDFLKAPELYRESGIHLTDVIKAMAQDNRAKAWGDYDRLKREDKEIYEKTFFEPGYLWEEVLSHVYGERWAKRPKPFQYDGIWLSPDGIFTVKQMNDVFGLRVKQTVLAEFKYTASKPDKEPTDDSKINWLIQTKAYCYALGLTEVVFIICYSKGDYKWNKLTTLDGNIISIPPMPLTKAFYIQYTQQELEDNWKEILIYKEKVDIK